MASMECTKGGLNALKATQLYKADEFWANEKWKNKKPKLSKQGKH